MGDNKAIELREGESEFIEEDTQRFRHLVDANHNSAEVQRNTDMNVNVGYIGA